MMKGKAKWRTALMYVYIIICLSGVTLIITSLIRHRSFNTIDHWVFLPILLGFVIERAAKVPFGKDYLRAANTGNADWKIRFFWLVSVILDVLMIVAVSLYGYPFLNEFGGLFAFLWMALIQVPSAKKFLSHLSEHESHPTITGKVHA